VNLLLHACCGPCLIEPLDALRAEADEVTVVFGNPNIQPYEEYLRRRDVLVEYATREGVDVVELEYDLAGWLAAVGPLATSGEARCRACFRLRFVAAARFAADNGYDAIATTLTVSPYQNAVTIAEEGRRAAESAGIAYVDRDFRDRYPDATRRSRELGMYRQNYCGCVMSDVEARGQREERRARKRSG